MTVRKILTWPDPRLHQTSACVTKFDESLRSLIADMTDTLEVKLGAGLAAIQIGHARRVVIIKHSHFVDDAKNDILVMVNPELELSGDKIKWEEACLSLPSASATIERFSNAIVSFQDASGERFSMDVGWPLAGAMQHECDHLDGVLYPMRMSSLSKQTLQKRIIKRRKKEEKVREAKEQEMRDDLVGINTPLQKKRERTPRTEKQRKRARMARRSRKINRRKK